MFEGEIIGTGRCKGLSQWIISVEVGHIIILKFQYFNILLDDQWIRVRDGDKNDDDLLAQSYGFIKISQVRSSKNKLLIQFMTRFDASVPLLYHRMIMSIDNHMSYKNNMLQRISSYGFIATYQVEG